MSRMEVHTYEQRDLHFTKLSIVVIFLEYIQGTGASNNQIILQEG